MVRSRVAEELRFKKQKTHSKCVPSLEKRKSGDSSYFEKQRRTSENNNGQIKLDTQNRTKSDAAKTIQDAQIKTKSDAMRKVPDAQNKTPPVAMKKLPGVSSKIKSDPAKTVPDAHLIKVQDQTTIKGLLRIVLYACCF